MFVVPVPVINILSSSAKHNRIILVKALIPACVKDYYELDGMIDDFNPYYLLWQLDDLSLFGLFAKCFFFS